MTSVLVVFSDLDMIFYVLCPIDTHSRQMPIVPVSLKQMRRCSTTASAKPWLRPPSASVVGLLTVCPCPPLGILITSNPLLHHQDKLSKNWIVIYFDWFQFLISFYLKQNHGVYCWIPIIWWESITLVAWRTRIYLPSRSEENFPIIRAKLLNSYAKIKI